MTMGHGHPPADRHVVRRRRHLHRLAVGVRRRPPQGVARHRGPDDRRRRERARVPSPTVAASAVNPEVAVPAADSPAAAETGETVIHAVIAAEAAAAGPRDPRAAAGHGPGPQEALPDLRRRPAQQIGTVYAVDGVDFEIMPGETFALVGESGCGKTTLGRTVIQLTPSTDGRVVFDGYELADVDPEDMRPLRRRMQIIFQDPFGSLNPRMPISDIIGEGLLAQGLSDRRARDKRVEDALELVGLRREYTPPLPARVLRRPAAAHRRRPGPRAGSGLHRRGRARVGPRRVDPEPGPEPAPRPQARPQADLPVHQPQPVGRAVLQRPGRGHVPRQDRRGRARSSSCTRTRATRTRSRCCPRSPKPTRAAARSASSSRATCRRRPRPRPAAGSTPAAGSASGSATPSAARPTIPSCGRSQQEGHRVACHFAEDISQSTVEKAAAETPAVVAAAVEVE